MTRPSTLKIILCLAALFLLGGVCGYAVSNRPPERPTAREPWEERWLELRQHEDIERLHLTAEQIAQARPAYGQLLADIRKVREQTARGIIRAVSTQTQTLSQQLTLEQQEEFAEPGFVSGSRESTNVPSQALFLLNSPFIAAAAQKLGERVIAAYPGAASFEPRVQLAYWLVFSRAPSEAERQAASGFFSTFPVATGAGDLRPVSASNKDAPAAAWTSFCRVLFASAEFRYLK